MNRRFFALAALCVGILFAAAPIAARAEATITEAAMGTAVDANFQITKPASQFAVDTPNIYCAWTTDGVDGETVVKSVWIAEDVGKVAPPNYKIDEASLKITDDQHGSFHISKPNNGWPVGKYRVEIYLGDKLAKTVPFTIQ